LLRLDGGRGNAEADRRFRTPDLRHLRPARPGTCPGRAAPGHGGRSRIAPAPDFDSSGRFYAAYAGIAAAGGQEGDVHVDSFRSDPSAPGQLIREPVISIGHSTYSSHNGGQLQFGPDGYLYVSLGDRGGGGDPLESGQDTETLLGKILRIDRVRDSRPDRVASRSRPPASSTSSTLAIRALDTVV